MSAPTSLRRSLDPEAADLYDSVQSRYPRFEDGVIQRRGSNTDDAFRHVLRAAIDNTATPDNWQQAAWPDDAVAVEANDPVVRDRAWALLADEEPGGWRWNWTRRNGQDRVVTYCLYGAAVVVVVVVALWAVFNG